MRSLPKHLTERDVIDAFKLHVEDRIAVFFVEPFNSVAGNLVIILVDGNPRAFELDLSTAVERECDFDFLANHLGSLLSMSLFYSHPD